LIFQFDPSKYIHHYLTGVIVDALLTSYYYWFLVFNILFLGMKYEYIISSNKLIIPESKRKEVLLFLCRKSLFVACIYLCTKLLMTFIMGLPFTMVPPYQHNDPESFQVYKIVLNLFLFYYVWQRRSFSKRVEQFKIITQSQGNKKAKELMYLKHLHNLNGLSDLYAKMINKIKFESVENFKKQCKDKLSRLLLEMKRDYIENIEILQDNKDQMSIQRNTREFPFAGNWFIKFYLADTLIFSLGYLSMLLFPESTDELANTYQWTIRYTIFGFYCLECTFANHLCHLLLRDKKNFGWSPELEDSKMVYAECLRTNQEGVVKEDTLRSRSNRLTEVF